MENVRDMFNVFKKGREGLCELKDGKWTRADEMKKFLVEAKLHTYGQPDSDVYTNGLKTTINYTSDKFPDFHYRDRYFGSEIFHGIETVSIRGVEVYALTYSGVEYVPFKDNPAIAECLSKALKAGPEASSDNLRGLDGTMDQSKRYEYHVWYNYVNGHISGTEIITDKDNFTCYQHPASILLAGINGGIVYRCDFSGGLII